MLTRQSKEDDFLVGPLFRGIVLDGNAAGRDVGPLLRPWDVTVQITVLEPSCHGELVRGRWQVEESAHEKTTSGGKVSPTCKPGIVESFQ